MTPDTRSSSAPRRVAILGIDNVSRKNRPQLEELNRRGFVFDVFTNDSLGDSASNVPPGNTLTIMPPGPAARIGQLVRYFQTRRDQLCHVEVYPGGRFAAVYVALAKRYGAPVMVVERGDLLYRDRYGAVTALSMGLSYRFADVVWYREFYQAGQRALEEQLRALGARRLFFLPNAVPTPAIAVDDVARTTDFVWANSLKAERKSDWLVDILAEAEFADTSTVMLGFLDDHRASPAIAARQDYVRNRPRPNLQIGSFADPRALFRRGRFFLLPSDMVFCNNALLEAMASGVVPLVSDVEGARLIVDDGVNGFVFPHSPAGLRDAMRAALRLSPEEFAAMSLAATEKVRTHFSMDRWADRLAAEYAWLRAVGASPPPVPARPLAERLRDEEG